MCWLRTSAMYQLETVCMRKVVIRLLSIFLCSSVASYATDLTLTREVIIQREGPWPSQPNVITRADGGGFILAGGPWAIKTDSDGKVLWRYVRDKFRADYTGAVAMPDGTTYLCGNISVDVRNEYKPTILTHLDASGLLINEQIFTPQNRTEHGLSYFDSCVEWGDGIAIVGHVSNSIRRASGSGSTFTMPVNEYYYWLLKLDSAGKMQWEQHIPTTLIGLIGNRSLLVAPDSSLVFAGHVNSTNKTELFRVSSTGEVITKKLLSGNFQFLRHVAPDGMLKIFGDSNKSSIISTLDNQLEETHRIQGDQPSEFYTTDHLAYLMQDQSLVLFGENIQSGGAQYSSAIAHVDSTLQSAKKIELVHAPFYDSGVINAATPTGNDGEFVTARSVLKHIPEHEVSEEAHVGVVLNFIQIK